MTRNPEIGNKAVFVDTKFVSDEKLLNTANCQVCNFYCFRDVKEKSREGVKIPLLPSRLALKCPEILNRVEVGNPNSQHK